MSKYYRSFHVYGINPRDLSEELNRMLTQLQTSGWHIVNVDCHENPKGLWNGKEYITNNEYIIIAWHEDIEE